MATPPSKIKLNLDAYNRDVRPVPSRRRNTEAAKKAEKKRDEELEKNRLAAIRAQNTVDAKIDREVQQQTQNITALDTQRAQERPIRENFFGPGQGQTFVPNLDKEGIKGPAGIAAQGIHDVWDTARHTGGGQLAHRIPGIAPEEFHSEVAKQRNLIQAEQNRANNPFEWIVMEAAEHLVPSTMAIRETGEDFHEIGVGIPGQEPAFHVNTADLLLEIADITQFIGPGAFGKAAALQKVNKVVRLAEKGGVRGAEVVTMTSKEVVSKAKEGVLEWNSRLGTWVDQTVSNELLRTSPYDIPRALPDEVPLGPLAKKGRSTKPDAAQDAARTFRFDDPNRVAFDYRGRKVSLNEVANNFSLIDKEGMLMDIRPWDRVVFDSGDPIDFNSVLEFVVDANFDIGVNRQTRQGIGKGLVPYTGKGKPIATGRKQFTDYLEFAQRKGKDFTDATMFDDEEFDAALKFIKLLPDEYFDEVSLSLRKQGRRDHSIVGGKAVLPDPDEAFDSRVIGLYEPASKLITIYTRKIEHAQKFGIADANEFVSTIVHEIGHHLENLIDDEEFRGLLEVYEKQKAAWDSIPDPVSAMSTVKNMARAKEVKEKRMQALFGTGYKMGGVEPRDYRFTTFHEWFAETMADKALRDLFPQANKQVAKNLAEKIKLLAVAMYRMLKKDKPEIAEQVYQDLVLGKYKGEKIKQSWNRADDIKTLLDDMPDLDKDVKVTWRDPFAGGPVTSGTRDEAGNFIPNPTSGKGVRPFGHDSLEITYGTSKLTSESGDILWLSTNPEELISSSDLATEKLLRNWIRAGVRQGRDSMSIIIPTDGTAVTPPTMLKQFGFVAVDAPRRNFQNQNLMEQEWILDGIRREDFKAPKRANIIKDLWGKVPSRSHSPQPPNKWVSDDIPYSPEQTVQNPFKDKFFGDAGIELTDHDEIVFPHEVVMPRKADGTVDVGAIVKVRQQLEKLEKVVPGTSSPMIGPDGTPIMVGNTVRDSLEAVAATIVRQTKTAAGLRQAYNLNRLFEMDDAIARTVDLQFNTNYSRLLQAGVNFPKVGGLLGLVVRERFPRVLQEAAQAYDGMVSNFNQAISGEFYRLHKKFDQTFRGMEFSITEPLVNVKGKPGVTRPGVVRQAFADIDRLLDEGVYSSQQAHALKLGIQFQSWRTAFDVPRETERMFKRLENVMEDSLRIEILSGAFRGATNQVAGDLEKAYLPQIWKFDGDLLDTQNKLTDAGFQKIFGTKQFFEKSRQFPSIALAVVQMAKEGKVPIRLADEIKSPLDLIGARLMAGGRIISDKFLNDEVAAAKASGLISSSEERAFKSILGGGSGEVSTQTEKALSGLVDLTLTGPLRMLRFSLDLGVLGVQALPSVNYLAANPLKTVKMAQTAAKYFTRPDAFLEYAATHPERWARAERAGLKVGQEILQKGEGGDWAENVISMRKRTIRGREIWVPLPKMDQAGYTMPEGIPLVAGKMVYNPIRLMNEAQFARTMGIIKMEAFEMESDLLWSNSPWNKAQRAIFGWDVKKGFIPVPRGTARQVKSRLEADLAAAHAVNERFGGLSNSRALQGKAFRKILTVPLLTPDFAQATMATALRPIITPSTPEATLARGFWVRNLAITTMIGVALQQAFGGEEINFTNPLDSDFFVWKVGGDTFNLLGRYGTHFKLLAASVGDVADFFQGETPRNMSDTGYDLSELNTFHRWENFINGRPSAPIELTMRLNSQKDYRGEPFWEEDMDPHITDYAKYIAAHGPVPISIVQIREDMANREFTWARAAYAFMGLSQYPIDLQREQALDSMQYHLANQISELTGAQGETALAMARHVTENRNPEFGNRIRPDIVIDPRTGQRLDIDMNKVYAGMATSLGFYLEGTSQLDLERARRLGDAPNMTPKERQADERWQRDKMLEDLKDLAQEKIDVGYLIEEQYGPGLEYPTYQSAIRRVGEMMSRLGGETKKVHLKYGDVVEALSDKRLDKTEQELAFEVIRDVLDETVRVDGTVDHWTRTRRMDELEALDPETMDAFFEQDEWKNEAQIVRQWRQMVATASDYYEIPARLFSKEEYETWREWTKIAGDKSEEIRYEKERGTAAFAHATALAIEVDNARIAARSAKEDIVALELSLWFLDGRRPVANETINLIAETTGTSKIFDFPSATEFERAMDPETMLEVLSRGG
jgi:hypothetical protein